MSGFIVAFWAAYWLGSCAALLWAGYCFGARVGAFQREKDMLTWHTGKALSDQDVIRLRKELGYSAE